MMASEYKKRGGRYTTDKKDQDESQKHLSEWIEEEWQTKEGECTCQARRWFAQALSTEESMGEHDGRREVGDGREEAGREQ